MRKKFIAGNWKMNLDRAGAVALAGGLKDKFSQIQAINEVDVVVCPPFVYLWAVAQALAGSYIEVGAQDVYFEPKGAFTGEISVEMLKDTGCQYVIVGHSERRHVIGESDELINKKLRAVLAGGLQAILCIGELLAEREANETEKVIERQLRGGLAQVEKQDMSRVTIAYEPVWAIGTGKVATPDQAQQAHAFGRRIIAGLFDDSVSSTVRIQYGGSVKPDNMAEQLRQPDVDGALVGGASLKIDDFMSIIEAGEFN